LLVAGGFGSWWLHTRLSTPYRGFTQDEIFVEFPAGTSVSTMAARLTDAAVVSDPLTFRIAARLSGAERHLQAGEYRFAEAASPYDVVARLSRGDVYVHPLTFPEGLTIKEMAAIFERSGLGTGGDFEAAGRDPSLIAELDPDARNLEGYLFPDTYALARHVGASGTVDAMVSRFKAALNIDLRAAATAQGMTIRQVVTLASIIEKETAAADERPLIAAVYRNRLERRMALQCDPTVIYAMMKAGKWRGNLSRADLQIDSPYNTYRYPGLPPGPIASPGRLSLEAAVRPADVPYLYFVSRNDGTHVFASTLDEHNRNVAKWQVQYFKRQRLN
jgi:UPF0755 protein